MAERKMQITADTETRRRYYADLTPISHRKEKFILDLPFLDPQTQKTTEGQAMLTS